MSDATILGEIEKWSMEDHAGVVPAKRLNLAAMQRLARSLRATERDRLAERLFVQDWDSTMDESAWAEEVRRAYAAADVFLKRRAEQREEGEG